MSKLFEQNRNFLHLLLNTTIKQQIALLTTLTKAQSLLLVEIVYNLQRLNVGGKTKAILKKHKKLFKQLSKSTVTLSSARSKKNILLNLLLSSKDKLLEI